MSQENVEVAKAGVEAWNRSDLRTWLALFRADAEIDWSRARGPLRGVYRGHGELEAFWGPAAEIASTFSMSRDG